MNEIAIDVLLVRGAPGVGKSSAAKAFRKLIPSGAIVEVDHVRGMIASVRWVDTAHHLVALSVTRSIVRSFLEQKFRPVVVVDTFSRGKLKVFIEQFVSEVAVRHRIASLYAEESTLLARVQNRPQNEFREPEISAKLNDEVKKNRYEFEELIDTTHLTPTDVASRLLELIGRPT